MSRKRTSYRPRLEQLEQVLAPNSLWGFAWADPFGRDGAEAPSALPQVRPESTASTPAPVELAPGWDTLEVTPAGTFSLPERPVKISLRAGGVDVLTLVGSAGPSGPGEEVHVFQHVYFSGIVIPELAGEAYSNYDAPWMSRVLANSGAIGKGAGTPIYSVVPVIGTPYPPGYQWQNYPVTVTYAAGVGNLNVFTHHPYGVSGAITTSFQVTGLDYQIYEVLGNTLFLPPGGFQGDAPMRATSSDSLITTDKSGLVQSVSPGSPVQRTVLDAVTRYDEGQYNFAVTSLDQSAAPGGAPDPLTPPGPQGGPEEVRHGIDWATLMRKEVNFTLFGGALKGDRYEVKTSAGNTVKLFTAYAMADQPKATRTNPNVQDITYNCHGYTWRAENVPEAGGKGFWFYDAASVNTLIADTTTGPLNVEQARTAFQAGKLIYVFYDAADRPIHSARMGNQFGTHDGKFSSVNSTTHTKNGMKNLQENVNVKNLLATYSTTKEVKMYRLN